MSEKHFFSISLVLVLVVVGTGSATTFYVDPVNGFIGLDGSAEFPWSTLEEVFDNGLIETRDRFGSIKNAGGPVKAGDTILLRSGYHGDINVSQYFNDQVITIAAEEGHTPELKRFRLSGGKNWLIRGLTISPSLAPVFERVTMVDFYSRTSSHGICSNITIEDCFLYTILDSSGWSDTDWDTKACSGIALGMNGGANLIARNNHLLNVNFGIMLQAQGSIAEYNTIENFSGDGIRATFHDVIARYNLIKNCYDVNDNHDDGIQSYLVNVGPGAVYRINLIGNVIINISDPAQPLQGTLQGIGIFDGPFYDFVVENNVVMTNHWHGITLKNSQNARIVNNTVFNKWWYDGESGLETWIEVTAGSTSGGNLIRNCIAHSIRTSEDSSAQADHNLIISRSDNADEWFVDYSNFDMHLATPASPPVDAGSSLLAPDEDIEGIVRPQGPTYDIGAYEYAICAASDFTGDCVVDFEDAKIMTDDWLVRDYNLAGSLSTGLVSHYKFDGDANDSVGGNDGTEVGNPTYSTGLHGQAISLDGDGDYVNCGNDASFDITGSITLSALIKGTFNSNWDPIISKGFNWQLTRGMGNEASFFCIGLGSLSGTTNINDDQWHHVAGVYNGSMLYLYVDGKLDACKGASGSLNVSASSVYIGGSPSQSFNGLVDDVLVYNRALSKTEIEYLAVRTDLNKDGTINFKDFAELAENWLR